MDGTVVLKRLPYFHHLDSVLLEWLSSQVIEISLESGDVVLSEGEDCKGLHFLIGGMIKVSRISPEGREQVLTIIRPCQRFGDVPVFDNGPNPATASALEPSVAGIIPIEVIRRLIESHPDVAEGMLKVFASRLRNLTMLVADLTHFDVMGRIAKVLLTCYASSEQTTIRIGQQDIASMVGSTREVVARSLRTLEDQGGLVRKGREIEIVSIEVLENVLEQSAR